MFVATWIETWVCILRAAPRAPAHPAGVPPDLADAVRMAPEAGSPPRVGGGRPPGGERGFARVLFQF